MNSPKFLIVLLAISALLAACTQDDAKNMPSYCNYESKEKVYKSRSAQECTRAYFHCEPPMLYFTDDCGCGCMTKSPDNSTEPEKNYCTAEQRKAQACIQLYSPVCGWMDPARIQCIRYPCANEFSNSCFACMNEDVLYWTEGKCPLG